MVINASLDRAFENELIKKNPYIHITLMPYRATRKRALEISEQNIIFDSINIPKYKNLFFFACVTGIRIGRILELKFSDFDKNNYLNVIKKQLKGLHESYFVPVLEEYVDNFKNNRDLLFPDITYNSAKKYFEDLFKRLNIKDITIHSFRHTFVSMLYLLNVKDKQIQEWAGHNMLEVTMNTYTHLLKNGSSFIKKYLEKLVEIYAR